MSGPLHPTLRNKLVKVCARFASEHDGERAAAALLAHRLLAGAGLSWEAVIASGLAAAPDPAVAMRRAQAARPRPDAAPATRRAWRHPDDERRAARFEAELRFVRDHLHMLSRKEQEDFAWRSNGPFGWSAREPTRQDAFTLDYLAGVIRRRMEEAA